MNPVRPFWRLFVCAAVSAAVSLAAGNGDSALVRARTFPASHYTPHGYIDNPWHSMVANRSGVIRSHPPLGFGYWRDTFKGAYGSGVRADVNYLSLLNFSITQSGATLFDTLDFAANGVELSSFYHTKHVMSYDWTLGACTYSIAYYLPREHTLAALVTVANGAGTGSEVTLDALHRYVSGSEPWWGSNGHAAFFDSARNVSVSTLWAYGDVFALGADAPSVAHSYASSEKEVRTWVRADAPASRSSHSVSGRGPMIAMQRYRISVPAHGSRTLLVCLSRGPNERAAKEELRTGLDSARGALGARMEEDEEFWKNCPMLEGDWQDSWKHGWVYDFETLRMNVRPPLGIFRHPWDAMQVHSPRMVLGETALDMATLSYADRELAKEVLYGTFADAIAPNVPCAREDGSVNMISSDGSECGTAPMWGYPFHMIRNIYLVSADTAWIARMYPHMAQYLEWWLAHRTDAEGWLHCNNSWESGQDGSRRFLVAEHNEAAVADFVRTVDVEASMAEAMRIMRNFASMLGRGADAAQWERLAERRLENTRSMFVDGWFRDIDARSKRPIMLEDNRDVAFLTPLVCLAASAEQVRVLKPQLAHFANGHEWPPGLFTLSEGAWNASERALASEAVARTADRVYSRTDRRSVSFRDSEYAYRVPGVANEFWPERDVPAGGENYGWGATLPLNILRAIVGFREADTAALCAFTLAPSLPRSFMTKGKRYMVRSLRYRNERFDLTYAVGDSSHLTVELRFVSRDPSTVRVRESEGAADPMADAAIGTKGPRNVLAFEARNHARYTVTVSDGEPR